MEKHKSITFSKVKGDNGKWRVQVSLFGMFFVISNTPMKFRSNNSFTCVEKRQRLKIELMRERGNRCELCGTSFTTAKMEVHHIKPQSLYPELREAKDNLMLLCHECHSGLHKEKHQVPATKMQK